MNKPKLKKPQVMGSVDEWGTLLNMNIDSQDAFNQELIQDSSRQDQELVRLDRDKISQSEITTVVKNTVDNYVDTTTKPHLNQHVETVNKTELDRYTSTKKVEISAFTNEQKVELDQHEKVKENEISQFVEGKKTELIAYVDATSKVEIDRYTVIKKDEIDTFTEGQKTELDGYEKTKESQLNNHTSTKINEINVHVADTNKVDIDSYTSSKKVEINTFTDEQKVELDDYERVKETQLDTHTNSKKVDIDNYVRDVSKVDIDNYIPIKKTEISDFTNKQKNELDVYEKTKESQLDTHTTVKINEINTHVTTVSKVDINNYTTSKKSEINDFTDEQKIELDTYEKTKETQITTHTNIKITEINDFTDEQKVELTTFTGTQKVELDGHEKLKEVELNTHTTYTELPRITTYVDEEIERIKAVGVGSILEDIDFTTGDLYNFSRDENSEETIGIFKRIKTYKLGELVDKIYLDKQNKTDDTLKTISKDIVGAINEIKDISIPLSKGKGISIVDGAINVVSANDGIVVDESIKLNLVNDLTTGGVTKAPTAEQVKVLNTKIDTKMDNSKSSEFVKYTDKTLSLEGLTVKNSIETDGGTLKHIGGFTLESKSTETSICSPVGILLGFNSKNDKTKYDNTKIGAYISLNANGFKLFASQPNETTYTEKFSIDLSGNTTNAGYLISSNDISAFSDKRIKKNIEVIKDPLQKILALNGYTFDRIDIDKKQLGLIAQEVLEVLPEATNKSNNNYLGEDALSVSYGNMIGLLVEGIKEQQKQIDELKESLGGSK